MTEMRTLNNDFRHGLSLSDYEAALKFGAKNRNPVFVDHMGDWPDSHRPINLGEVNFPSWRDAFCR